MKAATAPRDEVVDPKPPYNDKLRQKAAWSTMRQRGADLGWVLFGRIVLTGANAALMLCLAQFLPVPIYGLFVAAVGAQILLSRVTLLGVDHGMTRLRTVTGLREKARDVEWAGLLVVLCGSAGVGGVAALTTAVACWVPHFPFPAWVIGTTAAGAIGTGLFDYACAHRLARADYRRAGLLQLTMPLTRLVATLLVLLELTREGKGGSALILPVFLVYAGVGLLFGAVQAAALARETRGTIQPNLLRRVSRYSAWKAGADLALCVNLYQNTFLLLALGQNRENGVLGLAVTLSMGFLVLKHAVSDYLFTRMVKVRSANLFPRFLAKVMGASGTVALACIPAMLFLGLLASRFLKPELLPALPVFYLLTGAVMLWILQGPLEDACQFFMKPQFVLVATLARVAAVGILSWHLAPRSGAWGAATAQLAGSGFGLVSCACLAAVAWRNELRKSTLLPTTESASEKRLTDPNSDPNGG